VADKLLIRAYNVEVGDCIYVRIPRGRSIGGSTEDFHILIDCGSLGGAAPLQKAVDHLHGVLPSAPGGKKRLDLLVVTHEHKDHIHGFGLEAFNDLAIGQIWMSCAMDPAHPQAEGTHALRAAATAAMRSLAGLDASLSPELRGLVELYGLENEEAMLALRTTLPQGSGITPRYVHAGMTGADTGLPLQGATIRVLGPEQDIDHFYLGEDIDNTLHGFAALNGTGAPGGAVEPLGQPANISPAEFRTLRSRLVSNALAFAEMASEVVNNTSVILLIEWKGKRLLFVGDAEWKPTFKVGKHNGSWNTMWSQRKALLNKAVHFLKIGHHGSENSTPWDDDSDPAVNEPGTILDAILPRPSSGQPRAKAVVSTLRERYKTIPRSLLLTEIARRVSTRRNYKSAFASKGIATTGLSRFTEYEQPWFGTRQPWRTDCEKLLDGGDFVDIAISGS
jgi:hypothetical protein